MASNHALVAGNSVAERLLTQFETLVNDHGERFHLWIMLLCMIQAPVTESVQHRNQGPTVFAIAIVAIMNTPDHRVLLGKNACVLQLLQLL